MAPSTSLLLCASPKAKRLTQKYSSMPKPEASIKTRACDSCHRRKIQCDRTPLQCNWCEHHGLVCTFDRPFGRRKRTRKPGHASRVDKCPNLVRDGRDTDAAPPTQAGCASSVTPPPTNRASRPATDRTMHPDAPTEPADSAPCAGLGGFYFDGLHLGGISSQHGIPFFSEQGYQWIREHVGSTPVIRPYAPESHGRRNGQQFPTRTEGSWELPDRSLVEEYFRIFFRSAMRYVFPIVNAASFVDVLDRAYGGRRGAPYQEAIRARACVLSFTAVLIHMEGNINPRQRVDDEQCAARAESLMPHILADASSESLQVCAMLSMYHLYSGNTSVAGIYLSIACRFVLMLGAHLQPLDNGSVARGCRDTRPTSVHLRGLFWLCYMFDKDMCLRAGYPPVIDDAHCDLRLPLGYKQIGSFDDLRDGSDVFPGDMRLSIIKADAVRLLYCARAFRKSDAELLRDIRELDGALEAWRTSVPALHRPTLACAYRIRLEGGFNKPKKVHLIVIHLEYYFLLALFHSASGRCRAWASGGVSQTASVTSSQALALQASRATILNLAAVADVFNCGDFWFFIIYPLFASLTIFGNILLSPLNPVAEQDTKLLEQVPSLIEGLRARRTHGRDGARVEQVQEFVLELVRLAKLAVERAARERWERDIIGKSR